MKKFSMIRFEKVKTFTGVKKVHQENKREDKFANRANVDAELSSKNIMTDEPSDKMKEEILSAKSKWEEKNDKKLRKDFVKMLTGVVAYSQNQPPEKVMKVMQEFAEKWFPNCYCDFFVHVDEGGVHGHINVCAIDRDGNCITDTVLRPKQMSQMQDDIAEISQQNGLDVVRGVKKIDRIKKGEIEIDHKENWQFFNTEEGQKWLENRDRERLYKQVNEWFKTEKGREYQIKVKKQILAGYEAKLLQNPDFQKLLDTKKKAVVKKKIAEFEESDDFLIAVNEGISASINQFVEDELANKHSSGAKGEEMTFDSGLFESLIR